MSSLLDLIVDGFFNVVSFLKTPVPLSVLGFSITWWEVTISFFICGTVINILVGSDDELDSD